MELALGNEPGIAETGIFPTDPGEARRIQEDLRQRVRLTPIPGPVRRVAGIDAAFSGDRVVAVASVLSYPGLQVVEEGVGALPIGMPYIPGLLSFREGPAILEAIGGLTRLPDLFLFDGQGIAHPRRLGIASHIGVLLDRPSIGVGKSRLVGEARVEGLARRKGATLGLWLEEEKVGMLLRSREGTRPLYVSPGHRVTREEAVAWTLACCTRYRLPEPIRRADRSAARHKAAASGSEGAGERTEGERS